MNIEQYKNGTREIGGGKSKERGKEGKREREVEREAGERGEEGRVSCTLVYLSSFHQYTTECNSLLIQERIDIIILTCVVTRLFPVMAYPVQRKLDPERTPPDKHWC